MQCSVGDLHSENGYLLARPNLGADQRAVGSDTSTQHRGGHLVGDVVWNLEGEVFMGAYMAGIAALRYGSIRVWGTVCI